jgi:hypothetical protein
MKATVRGIYAEASEAEEPVIRIGARSQGRRPRRSAGSARASRSEASSPAVGRATPPSGGASAYATTADRTPKAVLG